MNQQEQDKSTLIQAEELWDEYSQHIGDDVSSLESVAGTSVITRSDFIKAIHTFKRQQWISVEDRLPELNDRVLIVESDGFMTICKYCTDEVWTGGKLAFLDEQDEQPGVCNPTHWMSLPEPPLS